MAIKEPTGAYNRAPIFDGENYDYGKECMSVHIQSVDMDVWDAVANNVSQDKPKADWSDDDKKKVQYDLKAQNILISSLGLISIIMCLIVILLKIYGMHWKPFTKEPMKLNNQKLIPLCNNMNFFA